MLDPLQATLMESHNDRQAQSKPTISKRIIAALGVS
jgi:hypothetical protein